MIRSKDNLLNYYSSCADKCYSTIAINDKQPIDDDDVVGINCFDEILLRSEFISYLRDNFKEEINKNIKFFSKRLNLYVYRDYY